VDNYTVRLEKDKKLYEKFRSDPVAELNKLGIIVNPESLLGKRLIECAAAGTGDVDKTRCLIYRSRGNCWYFPIGSDD